jgi:hypothetical protein
MMGKQSPRSRAPSTSAGTGAAARELVEFEDIGHMGPVTHSNIVNETIIRFLERT